MDVLVVDGYNVIGAWEELVALKQKDIGQARDRLIEILVEYQAFTHHRVIIVFDALFVKGKESRKAVKTVEIIYTKEEETADECIERLVKSLKNVKNQVYVATSDYMEQRTIFSRGALRISARELLIEINNMESWIAGQLTKQKQRKPKLTIPMQGNIKEQFEKWRRGHS
jgi:predicted RNA-binding protein with PIN domain